MLVIIGTCCRISSDHEEYSFFVFARAAPHIGPLSNGGGAETQQTYTFDGSEHSVYIGGLVPNQYITGTNVNLSWGWRSRIVGTPSPFPWALHFVNRSVKVGGETLDIGQFDPNAPNPSGSVRFASNRFNHGTTIELEAKVSFYFSRINGNGDAEVSPQQSITTTLPVKVYNRLAAFGVGFPDGNYNGVSFIGRTLDVVVGAFQGMKYDTSLSQSAAGPISRTQLVAGLGACTAFYVGAHGALGGRGATGFTLSTANNTQRENFFSAEDVQSAIGTRLNGSPTIVPPVQYSHHDTCNSHSNVWQSRYGMGGQLFGSFAPEHIDRAFVGWYGLTWTQWNRVFCQTLYSVAASGQSVEVAMTQGIVGVYNAGLVGVNGPPVPTTQLGGDPATRLSNVYISDKALPSTNWYLWQ